jgi:ABC-type multidrug transport system fused ATPase/permease subunit
MGHLLRLLGLLRPHWRATALTIACVLGTAAFGLAMPRLVQWGIDFALGVRLEGGRVQVEANAQALAVAALAVVGVGAMRGLFSFGQQFLAEWTGQQLAYELRNRLYEAFQRLSFSVHDRAQTGQLMSRATQDVEGARLFITFGVLRMGYMLIMPVAVLAIMVMASWRLALLVWAFIPFILWRSVVMSRSLRPLWLRIQDRLGNLTTVLQEALSGFRVVKAFGREEYEVGRFAEEAQRLLKDSLAASRVQARDAPLISALWLVAAASVLVYGGWQVREGAITPGELTAFFLYLNLLQMPVRALGWVLGLYARAISAAQRIFEVLDAQPEVRERPRAMELRHVRGHVRFEDVYFSYDGRTPVLRGIDLEARPGEVVALVGPPGSGKTTLVHLIPRFYDVTSGRITIDGIDVRDVTLASLRRVVGIVHQDVFLFSATIRENIAYGVPTARQEEIERAAKAARIHDFILSLPEGYDTWVGERGITLSGGQRQRIAIARTLLRDPRILILDDSTSSVDVETERLIWEALVELMRGRTTFVIAHRAATLEMADQVLVLDGGRIVERGRHRELLARGGLYAAIYRQELAVQGAVALTRGDGRS